MAAKRKGAGSLSERVHLQSVVESSDGYGGVISGWATQFTEPARLMPLRGGEGVMAGRLQGTQPYVCTVRSSARMRNVTTAWQVVNARTGATYNITAVTNPDERNQYVDLLIVQGEPS